MNIEIASIFDLDSLVPLFDQYRAFYGKPSDPQATRDFLTERFIQQQSIVLLARDATGTALGFSQLYPIFSSVSLRKKFLLNDLYVSPTARQRGVGAALLDSAKRYGQATGAMGLTLSTSKLNYTAQTLYAANGWQLDQDYLNFDFCLEDRHA